MTGTPLHLARGGGGSARYLVLAMALVYVALMLLVPLAAVFHHSLEQGLRAYWMAIAEPDARSALRLSVTVTLVAIPLNTLVGIAAAWAVAKFDFRGKSVLLTLIDLPFAVSPVVSGLVFVLLFGAHGWMGPWLAARGIRVIFAVPGIVLATLFVTVPFVARELIPVLQEQGREHEEAAVSLGASGWQTFWWVTLPQMKWGLFYGIILLNARALGEFGAVSVVSGHIRGATNTLPLHVEVLYNEYQSSAAFAVASILTVLALATIVAKSLVEWRSRTGHGHPGAERL